MTSGSANLLMGVRTQDFVLLVTDKNVYYNGTTISKEINREIVLSDVACLTMIGQETDLGDFKDYVKETILMLQIEYSYNLPPEQVLHWVRREIADGLRSRDRVVVECLVGGYNKVKNTPYLGSIDALGTPIRDKKYVFGGEYVSIHHCYSIMDSHYKNDMSVEQAISLMKKCIESAKEHTQAPFKDFSVLFIDKDGVHHLPDLQ